MKDPTNCDTCQASLDNGYSYLYEGDKLVKSVCFKCARAERLQKYIKTKRLTSSLIMDNNLSLYHTNLKEDKNIDSVIYLKELKNKIDIQISYINIYNKMKEFEKEVWFKGLQKKVIDSRVKEVSAHPGIFSNFCVLTYTMAGRTMITIQDDNNSVSFVADETSSDSRTGFQGIDATEEQALSLIQMAIELYHNQGGTRLIFKEDNKVSMGF